MKNKIIDFLVILILAFIFYIIISIIVDNMVTYKVEEYKEKINTIEVAYDR